LQKDAKAMPLLSAAYFGVQAVGKPKLPQNLRFFNF